jgi:membrane fusion protein, heavy metal efflux system
MTLSLIKARLIFFAISTCLVLGLSQNKVVAETKIKDDIPFERGIHRGRMLRQGNFAIELVIFETGVEPQYRIYGYNNNNQLSPNQFTAQVKLKRLGRDKEDFYFTPIGDFLKGDKIVREPHSFDVTVNANFGKEHFTWNFPSYEGRTTLSEEVAKASGIKTLKVENKKLHNKLKLRGVVKANEHKLAHVIPRFSGLVLEGKKHIGDTVKKGEILATIESNESLQPFAVRSQITGNVIKGHVVVGEFVPENQWIYIIAELSEVWVDFSLPLSERMNINLAKNIVIRPVTSNDQHFGKFIYEAPYVDLLSQTKLIRAKVLNKNNPLLPGTLVTGIFEGTDGASRLIVKKSGLQKFKDWDVVFRKVGNIFEVAPVTIGKNRGDWIEIIEGLEIGDEYVSENSFLIKADILKSGATHDH